MVSRHILLARMTMTTGLIKIIYAFYLANIRTNFLENKSDKQFVKKMRTIKKPLKAVWLIISWPGCCQADYRWGYSSTANPPLPLWRIPGRRSFGYFCLFSATIARRALGTAGSPAKKHSDYCNEKTCFTHWHSIGGEKTIELNYFSMTFHWNWN